MLTVDLNKLLEGEDFSKVEVPRRNKDDCYGTYILKLYPCTSTFDKLPKPSAGKFVTEELVTTDDKISSGLCSYCFVCKDTQGKKYLFKGTYVNNDEDVFKMHKNVYDSADSIEQLIPTCKPLYEIVLKYDNHQIPGYVMEYLEDYQEFDEFIKTLDHHEKKIQARDILSKVLMYLCSISDKIENFCHLDIKSSNLLVRKNPNNELSVKLIDFGISSSNPLNKIGGYNISIKDYQAIEMMFSNI